MAYFCQLLGHETAKVARRGSDHLSAELPSFRAVFASVFQAVVRLQGADPDDDAAAFSVVNGMLVPAGGIPVAFDRRAYESHAFQPPSGVTVPREHQASAQYVGMVVGGIARTLQTGVERGDVPDEDDDEYEGGPPAPPSGTPESPQTVSQAIAQLRDVVSERRRDRLEQIVRSIEDAESTHEHDADPGPAALADIDTASIALDLVEALFGEALEVICPGHDFAEFMQSARAELVERFAVAAALSAVGQLFPGSSRAIGNRVHRVIQDRYEGAESHYSDIIAEMFDSAAATSRRAAGRRGGMAVSVCGPTTGGQRRNIRTLTNTRQDPMNYFFCANAAFSGSIAPTDPADSTLRPDLINKRISQLWEIKPTRAAAAGVGQELQYRTLFNLVREVLVCLGQIAPPPLESGGDIEVLSAYTNAPIIVTRQAGEAAIAVPYQVLPSLGPLILYLVYRMSDGVALATAVALLRDALARRLEEEERRRRSEEESGSGTGTAPAPAYSIDWGEVIAVAAMLLFLLVLAFLLAAELAAIAAVLGVLAGIGLVIDSVSDDLEGLSGGLARYQRVVTGTSSSMSIALAAPAGTVPRNPVSMRFMGLRVDGLPAELTGKLCSSAVAVHEGAVVLHERYLVANLRALRAADRGSIA